MTPQPTSPRTAAGRALLEALPRFFKGHAYWRDFEPSAPDRILAIEAEAAAPADALLATLVAHHNVPIMTTEQADAWLRDMDSARAYLREKGLA